VIYEGCVVTASKYKAADYRYVTELIRPPAQKTLVKYGFGPRPKP